MRHSTAGLVGVVAVILLNATTQGAGREKWTVQQANAWHAKQPWRVGCNFNPSTAINQLQMWQADTFDMETIDRELGWAAELGFNTIRVYMHNLLWTQDEKGFIERINRFLASADKHGIGVMLVPLDGVWNPHPKLGRQGAPRPHVHNSGWVQAPGAEILGDPKRHDELEPYIRGVVRQFGRDPRVFAWDVFNEPDNPNTNAYGERGAKTELSPENKAVMATALLRKLFIWARAENPLQPLTAGVWMGPWPDHERLASHEKIMLEESDVISFHNYGGLEHVRPRVVQLRRYGRPILCTEYMARPNGSRFDPVLGYFKQEKIAAYNWGFVAGKTQTNYPWDSWHKRYTSEPKLWFHEILRGDGTPYLPEEVNYIKKLTGSDATPLFNGKNLDNWVIENNGRFSVANGLLKIDRGTGWLRSADMYTDFSLLMEFRFLEAGSNSGIFVRTGTTSKDDENGWPDNGYQVQCMDTLTGKAPLATMIPYGAPPFEHKSDLKALNNAYKPVGEWQIFEITCSGETMQVKLNGTLITTATRVKNLTGHVGIQGEHGLLEFRTINLVRR